MGSERIHTAVSHDGTRIAGRVDGDGPPLVLVHGAVADGESEFAELVPLLTSRFTCYRPSTRGRGQSDAHRDCSRRARVQDITAFVDSIGMPVGLVGVSGGGMVALGAAAATFNVAALVASEPVVLEAIDEQTLRRFSESVDLVAAAEAEGRRAQGAKTFLSFVGNDEERAAFSGDPEALEEAGAYLAVDVAEFREALEGEGPSPTKPSVLECIAAPTLLLYGSRTGLAWFEHSTRYVARHVPDARVQEIAGNGHLGHIVHPERFADAIVPFLDSTLGIHARAASR